VEERGLEEKLLLDIVRQGLSNIVEAVAIMFEGMLLGSSSNVIGPKNLSTPCNTVSF